MSVLKICSADHQVTALQEEVTVIEGQVNHLKGLVQQQDALNAALQQRVQTAGEAEGRAKVPHGRHSYLHCACVPWITPCELPAVAGSPVVMPRL